MGGCILVRSSPFDPDDTNTVEERQKWRPQQMGHVGCELLRRGNELCAACGLQGRERLAPTSKNLYRWELSSR